MLNLNLKDSSGKRILKKLTEENYNVISFDWSPDGKQIVYSHSKSPEANDMNYSDVSIIQVESGKVMPIAATGAGESNPLFSPDGKYIAYSSTTESRGLVRS